MLDNILKLEGATVLSKNQQKSISGGEGTCAYYIPDDFPSQIVWIGVTSAEAQAAVQGGGHWCCTNCSSASWFNNDDYLHFFPPY